MKEIARINDEIWIDFDAQCLYQGKKKFEIRSKSIKILKYLCSYPNCYKTNEQIRDEIYDRCISDSTIRYNINDLRNNYGQILKNVIITKKGSGYAYIGGPIEAIPTSGDHSQHASTTPIGKDEFRNGLINCSRDILDRWEQQNYIIETDLLPSCHIKGTKYSSLYDCIKIELLNKMRNSLVQSNGGGGKTSSLVYVCRKISRNDKTIIPIFIKISTLITDNSTPLSSYLYSHIINLMNMSKPFRSEAEFITYLDSFLRESGIKILIVLDGCNEGNEESLADIDLIKNLSNTMVVASSRLADKKFADFLGIKLDNLENKTIVDYLRKSGIILEKNYDSKSLNLPIYLHMYSQALSDKSDKQQKDQLKINSQAEIIDLWIKEQEKIFNSELSLFAMEIYLPLLSLMLYTAKSPNQHRKMNIEITDCNKAVKEVVNILNDTDLKQSIISFYGINVSNLSIDDYGKILNEIIVRKLAIFQISENNFASFEWAHECYRDWFIAKGYFVLYEFSEIQFNRYFGIFLKTKFTYPDTFKINKDYPSFAVAVYLAELIGEDTLANNKCPYFGELLRSIAFFYEDIGDANNVVKYGKIIESRHKNPSISTTVYNKCLTLSGLAYSYLHIHNLKARNDSNMLVKLAKEMLDESEEAITSIVTVKCTLCISKERIMLLEPRELNDVFDKSLEYNSDYTGNDHIISDFNNIKKFKPDFTDDDFIDIQKNKKGILPLLSRIYGNLGSYYLNRFYTSNDRENLYLAHKNHLIGAAYKYLILTSLKKNDKEYSKAINTYAISMRSLGIDMFHAQNYTLSIKYFDYALNYLEADNDVANVIKAYTIRSKISYMLLYDSSDEPSCNYSILEIILEEISLLDYFKDNHMFGEIDRMVSVIANIITLVRMQVNNDEEKNNLRILIHKIEELHEKYFISDDNCKDLENYLDNGGKNKWQTTYE